MASHELVLEFLRIFVYSPPSQVATVCSSLLLTGDESSTITEDDLAAAVALLVHAAEAVKHKRAPTAPPSDHLSEQIDVCCGGHVHVCDRGACKAKVEIRCKQ